MDIHQSDIDLLEEKVKKLSYNLYLPTLRMSNVRSFENQTINFDFPVTAIIGTNGGGKSTVLGAAAIAYQSVKPGSFFQNRMLATIVWQIGALNMILSIERFTKRVYSLAMLGLCQQNGDVMEFQIVK